MTNDEWGSGAKRVPAFDHFLREGVLVKRLHLLETIGARIGDANGRRVYLTSDVNDESVDPAEAALRALESPLDHPPLSRSIVPGDRVAVAVGPDLLEAAEIVRGVVEAFLSAGVDAASCAVVAANEEVAANCRAALSPDGDRGISVVIHDPDDERDLCFVGLRRGGQPLVVNRAIFEADVVLPIAAARPQGGVYESLYPQFSSTAVIEEFRKPTNRSTREDRKLQRRAIREAGQLVGAPLVMQVVPGSRGSVAAVVAGEPRAVARRVSGQYREQWTRQCEQPANLVVATVTGDEISQTWENVGRAIAAAKRLVEGDGALAICTNVSRAVGESMGRLVGQRNASATARKLFQEHAEDSWAAWQIARAIARGPVFLMSQLDADEVEEMGMAPIENIDELVRLASRRESTIVLEDAHFALASVSREEN
jgi:nickel-dependent lactate racemase